MSHGPSAAEQKLLDTAMEQFPPRHGRQRRI
jgi:hypothetical protein